MMKIAAQLENLQWQCEPQALFSLSAPHCPEDKSKRAIVL
jgi:hypothetical protein